MTRAAIAVLPLVALVASCGGELPSPEEMTLEADPGPDPGRPRVSVAASAVSFFSTEVDVSFRISNELTRRRGVLGACDVREYREGWKDWWRLDVGRVTVTPSGVTPPAFDVPTTTTAMATDGPRRWDDGTKLEVKAEPRGLPGFAVEIEQAHGVRFEPSIWGEMTVDDLFGDVPRVRLVAEIDRDLELRWDGYVPGERVDVVLSIDEAEDERGQKPEDARRRLATCTAYGSGVTVPRQVLNTLRALRPGGRVDAWLYAYREAEVPIGGTFSKLVVETRTHAEGAIAAIVLP